MHTHTHNLYSSVDGEFSKHTHSVLTVAAPLPVVVSAMDGEFSKHTQPTACTLMVVLVVDSELDKYMHVRTHKHTTRLSEAATVSGMSMTKESGPNIWM